ncbi:MAG: DNA internalization-related competence protein ComEC/Rec2 [Tepidanaerobacteraceae bacterium]|jgi:competence protein ComEC|nr:DNA internalization-related competence protein ComEC/Rec2 [Tepidanaerobacteraceae bacterium]
MYRPFLFSAVFFLSGIAAGYFIKSIRLFLLFIAISFFGLLFSRGRKTKSILIGIMIFFAGAFYYNFRAVGTAGTIVNYAGKQQIVVGMVNDSPAIEADRVRYDIKALYILGNNRYKKVSGRILLSVLRDEKNHYIFRYGDVVKFSGKLKLPQGKRNPGGMDYRASLLQKGISTTMFSREIEYVCPYNANLFIKAAYSLRESISAFYEKNLQPNTASLLMGIVLGLKGGISGNTLRAFSDSGTIHLLAVSGMNTAIIYGALQWLFDIFHISRIISFLAGSSAIIFYCFMAGLSPSVLRAAIMIMVLMLGRAAGRKNDPLNSLGLAAQVLLLFNPLYLFSVSFQLSFAATLGIILFYKRFRDFLSPLPHFLRDSLAVIISAQLMVWPFAAYYFHKVSLISFFSNLAIVPAVGLILILGIVSGLIGLVCLPVGIIPVKITGALLSAVEHAAVFSSKLPFATRAIPNLSPFIIILYFILTGVIFNIIQPPFYSARKARKLASIMLAVLVLFVIIPKNSGLEVTFVDVGQGDCIFIMTENGSTVLIDGGGVPSYYNADFDVGSAVVEPFLYGRGVDHIDVAVFSHFDDDHARGLLTILKDIKVDTVIYGKPSDSAIYKDMLEIVRKKNIKLIQAGRGDEFYVGKAVFEVINPPRENAFADENDNSVVLKMTCENIRFLFTGDLGFEGERQLVNSGLDLGAVVLKAGHHGSATSTSEEFLSKVNPAIAVISAGKDNSFGHPSQRVLDLFKEKGVKIYRTDLQGAVTFKIQKNNVKIYTSIPGEMEE